MSNYDARQVSNITGTFPALKSRQDMNAPHGKISPEPGKEQPVPAKEEPDLEALASKLNVASRSIGRDLRFIVDTHSGRSVIQVLDRETGEIIREIPPDEARTSLADAGNMQIRLYDELA